MSEQQEFNHNIEFGKGRWYHADIHPWVFFPSSLIILVLLILALVFQSQVDEITNTVRDYVINYFGWCFLWTMNIVLVYIFGSVQDLVSERV